jgi:hypothetical protein
MTFSCAADANSCAMGSQAVACTTSQSCGTGQVCCYLRSAAGGTMGANVSQCMASCPTGARQVCMSPADCPMTGSMCTSQSGGIYGFSTCRPPPCTAPSGMTPCGTGQVCCTAGGGGATCQVGLMCAMGTQLCDTTAECMAPLVCRQPQGGGTMGCRMPIPDGGMPPDAGGTDGAPADSGPGDAAGDAPSSG